MRRPAAEELTVSFGVLAIVLCAALGSSLAPPPRSPATFGEAPAILSVIAPHQLVPGQRYVIYAGVGNVRTPSLIQLRVCATSPVRSCLTDRRTVLETEGESWGWIGAIAGAPSGEYHGQVLLMERNRLGVYRTVDRFSWELTVAD